jgi:hypothetical protein
MSSPRTVQLVTWSDAAVMRFQRARPPSTSTKGAENSWISGWTPANRAATAWVEPGWMKTPGNSISATGTSGNWPRDSTRMSRAGSVPKRWSQATLFL